MNTTTTEIAMYGYEVRTTTYARILCDRCAANCGGYSITTIELPGGQASGERASGEFCRDCIKEMFGSFVRPYPESPGQDESDNPGTSRRKLEWRLPRDVDVAVRMKMHTVMAFQVTGLLREVGDLIGRERREAADRRRRV